MDWVHLTINDQKIEAREGSTILKAAQEAGIYIPILCSHPNLPPAAWSKGPASEIYRGLEKLENVSDKQRPHGCGLCLVEVKGYPEPVPACSRVIQEGMLVHTETEQVISQRQENLKKILAHHPHACLTCAQQKGCSRTQCSSNVAEDERCCELFGNCELQNVANYVGIPASTPKWLPEKLPVLDQSPLITRDYNLCIGCTRCIRACRELRGIEALGFVFDEENKIRVGSLAPTLQDSGCKFCTACVHVCPTGALKDKKSTPLLREQDIVPCRAACPAHIDVPEYVRLAAQGRQDEAAAVIREKVPFPGVLGRVCFHPCEDVCRRKELNKPIAICALKRYAADGDKGVWPSRGLNRKEETGKKVAVIGSGPAGLTASFYLKKKGHQVIVFESKKQAGGMLRYGIPAYRLPRHILDQEIKDIFDLGIEVKFNQALGRNFTLEQLKSEGFDAVFVALGCQLSKYPSRVSTDLTNIWHGLDFLIKINSGEEMSLKDNLVVIGGGNVAIDVARTAIRIGVKEVTILYRRSLQEMPALPEEIKAAEEEGVVIKHLTMPVSFKESCQGKDLGVCCVRAELGPPDESGRGKPIPVEGTDFDFPCNQIILATGQEPELLGIQENYIQIENGLIAVGKDMQTNIPGIYAGGDVRNGPASVIQAVADGRQAASSIDQFLEGDGIIDEIILARGAPDQNLGRCEKFAYLNRKQVPELSVKERCRGFQEVIQGYDQDLARAEGIRCLQCDLRLYLGHNPSPPKKMQPFVREIIQEAPETEGVLHLYDEQFNVLSIKGCPNLRQALVQEMEEESNSACWFEYEEDKMYTQRETELIQQHLQKYGEMPGVSDLDLDDLF